MAALVTREAMRSVYTPRYRFFLARLRQARTEAGLSQVEAAARLHQTQKLISKSERGDRRVDVVELWEFARLYAKPLEFFLDMEAAAPAPASKPRPRPERR
jgi:transcriptional regulator with XRE-family HTH domain